MDPKEGAFSQAGLESIFDRRPDLGVEEPVRPRDIHCSGEYLKPVGEVAEGDASGLSQEEVDDAGARECFGNGSASEEEMVADLAREINEEYGDIEGVVRSPGTPRVEDDADGVEEVEEGRPPLRVKAPCKPSQRERDEHEATHCPFRS